MFNFLLSRYLVVSTLLGDKKSKSATSLVFKFATIYAQCFKSLTVKSEFIFFSFLKKSGLVLVNCILKSFHISFSIIIDFKEFSILNKCDAFIELLFSVKLLILFLIFLTLSLIVEICTVLEKRFRSLISISSLFLKILFFNFMFFSSNSLFNKLTRCAF